MIPRAALTADEIAKQAEFFCFGTNDLTQMTFGFSRDDAGKFLGSYYDAKILESDPFAKLDQEGVGELMKTAVKLGRRTRPDLLIGICGEHGGDPSSVTFCHKIGLDYVSCSPFRVPIARLAAAQAAIAEDSAEPDLGNAVRGLIDDETMEKLQDAAEKAGAIARDLAETSAEVARAGLAGLKAGIDEARRVYNQNKRA